MEAVTIIGAIAAIAIVGGISFVVDRYSWAPTITGRSTPRPYGFRSSAVCLSQWACTVIPFTAMPGPQPSARVAADPRTMRLALELLERTAGHRRRCRRCRSVIAGNARKRCQAWSVCTPCARAIEDDARQLEIEPAFIRRCLVCRTHIVHLRAGARTCGGACRNVLLRLLRSRCRPIP